MQLRLKFIPVAQVGVTAGLMLAVKSYTTIGHFEGAWSAPLSIVITTLGLALAVVGGRAFFKANTTINPIDPSETTALVTSGIYRFSRNPMYLGFLLILLAWAFFLGSGLSFVMLPIFVVFITRYQIDAEERVLEEKFGEVYQRYRAEVRRWI